MKVKCPDLLHVGLVQEPVLRLKVEEEHPEARTHLESPVENGLVKGEEGKETEVIPKAGVEVVIGNQSMVFKITAINMFAS